MNRAVVLEPNIIVSAGIHLAGPAGMIVDLVLDGELLMFVCPSIIQEYLEVLARERFAKHMFPPVWLPRLLRVTTLHPADPSQGSVLGPVPGPGDNDWVFLALAKSADAILVTGKLKDYPVAIRQGVTVLSPREYVDLWKGEET